MHSTDFIKTFDTQNQYQVLQDSYKQLIDAWDSKINLEQLVKYKFSSIVYCGLGGSAISGDLFVDYIGDELKLPFQVVRGYSLPSYVDDNCLVIISSYSGNTEETVSCFNQALKKKAKIAAITSGGKIGEIAEQNKIPVVKLRGGFQPRFALGAGFFSLLKIMYVLSIVDESKNIQTIIDLWKRKGLEYSSKDSTAMYFAEQIIGFIPVIYSSEFLSSTGYRMKSQLNENSKMHAFYHNLPEMNHNEIIGWESFKEKQFNTKVIYLLDNEYHPQNQKRFEILKEILNQQKIEVLSLMSNEENKKVRIMDLIFLIDWISFYASVLRGYDPSEIDFIHRMKQRLT